MNLQENIDRIKEVMGVINEAWVKRRLDMVMKAHRGASDYMIERFKNYPEFEKDQFTNIFFSIMMDELHPVLTNWGADDFDYPKVHQEIIDSFTDGVHIMWKELGKKYL